LIKQTNRQTDKSWKVLVKQTNRAWFT